MQKITSFNNICYKYIFMSWNTLTGDIYKIPNKTDIQFNPNSVLFHTPGLNVVILEEDDGVYPMSVPQHRFNEIQTIVSEENKIKTNEKLDVYVIDEYVTYPIEYDDNMIYDDETYLYEIDDTSFLFRVLSHDINTSFKSESISPKNDKILIEFLRGKKSAISKKSLSNYLKEGNVYKLICLDKQFRGLYKDSSKNPYWD